MITFQNKSKKIFLTQTVQKGGCAAKVAASELRKILGQVKFPKAHPELLVDGGLFDDAAIYKINDDLAMVQTLDFFTPIVDTPYVFGAVAATNALSDVYAMGGQPKTALGILAFPLATLSQDVIVEMLQGASDKIAEAKANFVGGHSIDDDTLKFGLSVTGYVHPQRVWSNSKAQEGDVLILTKPLGTGTMTAALKKQFLSEEAMSEVITSMTTLNNAIDYLNPDQMHAIHGATDITGFGLAGHSLQLAQASQVQLIMDFSSLPIFEGVMSSLEKEYLTKAHRTNAEYTKAHLQISGLSALEELLLYDPQTSGGLLLAVAAEESESILKALKKGFHGAQIIGEVQNTKATHHNANVFVTIKK